MSHQEICFMTATEMAQRIRKKELSAREVMEAHLAQIDRVNPKVNAVVTLLPDAAGLSVERLRGAGAIAIGKTNVPEFGAGSQTFNPVFGATLNPYDTTKTCGGSSGGAAVALACGMLPIADGSDMGGALRTPDH